MMRAMREKVEGYRTGALMRLPGMVDPAACEAALGEHGGFWGPFAADAAAGTP